MVNKGGVRQLGKELDMVGKVFFRDRRGTKHVQLYRNVIDGTTFINKSLKFVEVVKVKGFYVIKNSN
jgi:hypothetical protein